jgi:hypothetical protein
MHIANGSHRRHDGVVMKSAFHERLTEGVPF